ncbi:MAG: hypothetical protein EAZ85_01235 [Bacteroidetes bacterium]|nr:MAG: hypothetical protein EAZ85_01235 [Bacteroidota bacterium]TAG90424.1 MAG: hypothetical protein EAZ20_04325 [Bacteroidota bacterium]
MLGVTLSGGGTRGIAHIGVLHALEELKIKINVLAGVSSGAIVGVLYSAGYSPERILHLLMEYPKISIFQPSWTKSLGFFELKSLEKFIKTYVPTNDFSDLKIPITISAIDLEQGEEVYFSEGEIAKPLIASCCVPILFNPIKHQNRLLVDGGLLNGLITKPLENCDKKIGVHVNPFDKNHTLRNTKDIFERCFTLAVHQNSRKNLQLCDLIIEPIELAKHAAFRWDKARLIYEIGYYATLEKKDEILKLMEM